MIASAPDIAWDGRQTLTLAGCNFPVVLMVHPDGYRWDGPAWANDDGCTKGWTVTVPFESGLICRISYDPAGDPVDPLTAMLSYPVWDSPLDPYDTGPIMAVWYGDRYVPSTAINSRRRVVDQRNVWSGCDPEWLAEHLERIARLAAAPTPDGARGQWVTSLDAAIRIPSAPVSQEAN